MEDFIFEQTPDTIVNTLNGWSIALGVAFSVGAYLLISIFSKKKESSVDRGAQSRVVYLPSAPKRYMVFYTVYNEDGTTAFSHFMYTTDINSSSEIEGTITRKLEATKYSGNAFDITGACPIFITDNYGV